MNDGAPDPNSGRLAKWLEQHALDPGLAVIGGSGMSGLAGGLNVAARARLTELFDVSGPEVAGHTGELLAGNIAGVPALLFLGRFHLYQGLSAWDTVVTVRALRGTSVRILVVLNAAGGLNPEFDVGDIMLITDHINLPGFSGVSPFIPPRGRIDFIPMRGAYSPPLQTVMKTSAAGIGMALKHGVYAMVAGPTYETDAELRLLRNLGADAVGMSTVHEVVMARRIGLDVAGLSLITNRAVPGEVTIPSHDDVLRASDAAVDRLAALITAFARGIAEKLAV